MHNCCPWKFLFQWPFLQNHLSFQGISQRVFIGGSSLGFFAHKQQNSKSEQKLHWLIRPGIIYQIMEVSDHAFWHYLTVIAYTTSFSPKSRLYCSRKTRGCVYLSVMNGGCHKTPAKAPQGGERINRENDGL